MVQASSPSVSSASSPLVVIPARMAATRLPGKPLADIYGRPMILRMVDLARAANVGPVLVAAGDQQIVEAVIADGGQAILTDPDLPSGTDRIHAAVEALDPAGRHDVIINLQGDMPTGDPQLLVAGLAILANHPGCDIATLISPSSDPADAANPNVVKAIPSWSDGAPNAGGAGPQALAARCLYFTRANAPTGPGPVWRHVGLYLYRRAALRRFVAAPPSPLELREKLEQLRALELGMTIMAAQVADFPKGVDSPADLEAARAVFATRTQVHTTG